MIISLNSLTLNVAKELVELYFQNFLVHEVEKIILANITVTYAAKRD